MKTDNPLTVLKRDPSPKKQTLLWSIQRNRTSYFERSRSRSVSVDLTKRLISFYTVVSLAPQICVFLPSVILYINLSRYNENKRVRVTKSLGRETEWLEWIRSPKWEVFSEGIWCVGGFSYSTSRDMIVPFLRDPYNTSPPSPSVVDLSSHHCWGKNFSCRDIYMNVNLCKPFRGPFHVLWDNCRQWWSLLPPLIKPRRLKLKIGNKNL